MCNAGVYVASFVDARIHMTVDSVGALAMHERLSPFGVALWCVIIVIDCLQRTATRQLWR